MKRVFWILVTITTMILPKILPAQQNVIDLPSPGKGSVKPLMQILKERSSHREFSSTELSLEHLSGLLWAACGVNRPESGKRTAPSAMNWQDVQVYVFLKSGIFLYNEKEHKLENVKSGDYRAAAGQQDFVASAPLNLIFVSDYNRMTRGSEDEKAFYAGINTGFISENVYLYCASEGLNTVVRASVEKDSLYNLLNLKPGQHVVAGQTVGYRPE